MSIDWNKKQELGKLVKIGDGAGQVPEVEGLFLGTLPGMKYGKPFYNFLSPESKGGEILSVPENAGIRTRLSPRDVGKLVKVVFAGWGTTKAGTKVKQLEVFTYDGPVTEEIAKEYPKYGQVATPTHGPSSYDDMP